jgi:DGQHR domain-containing protein
VGSTNSSRLRYSVNSVTQGNHRFYALTLPSRVLARTCFVTTRAEDPIKGFQRTLDEHRAREIATYIDKGFGTIPTSIVLSAQKDANLRVVNRGKGIEFSDAPKAFLILDGQHRVYGFTFAKSELRVPVVIYNDLTRQDETRLFIDINTKQKPVPNALLLDIKRLAEIESDREQILSEIFDRFDYEPSSALLGLLARSEQKSGRISRVTFNKAVGPILGVFESRDAFEMFNILNSYLRVFHSGLESVKTADALAKSVVFRAIVALFPDVALRVKDKYAGDYAATNFAEILDAKFFRAIRPLVTGNVGNSVKALIKKFELQLRKRTII